MKVTSSDRIAVTGMACRFPRANNIDTFWNLLVSGRDATSELPQERWPVADFLHEDRRTVGTLVSSRAGLLDDIKGFDARYFGITPREAEAMDPQQRIALEVAYEAIEDAGIVTGPPQKIGVFVGAWSAEYSRRFHRNMPNETLQYWGTGNSLSVIANRISYAFNFRGTSMTVDTASSSSLLAIHLACRAIEAGDIDRAVVGGVNLLIDPITSVYFTKIGALSPDGLSKSFDADANGYVRAEGCGFVVLERTQDAEARRQRIYAEVLGTGSNQDGRSAGLTVPNGEAQTALIRETLARANVNAGSISYVEAHASGTTVGDPIEMAAIGEAYAGARPEALRIGSVKSNIGHLEAASGIAGFIKTVLAVERAELPPTLHYHTPNREIQLDHFNMRVQNTHTAWPKSARRIAAVNSFGLGGTNVHVLLGQSQLAETFVPVFAQARTPLILTARSGAALKERARQMIDLLRKYPSVLMQDIAGTLAFRRAHYEHRLVAIGSSHDEWAEKLEVFLEGGTPEFFATGSLEDGGSPERRVVFVFPGQGSQWLGMGQQLLASDEVFAQEIARIDQAMKPFRTWSVLDQLRAGSEESLRRLDFVQPLLMAVALGIAATLRARGVEPDNVIGHSQGEIAAAYCSGSISLSDACRIIAVRSELVEKTRGTGQMAVVGLSAKEADEFVSDFGISIAAYNSPRTFIVSGATAKVEAAVAHLQGRAVFTRMLRVGYASHSSAMDPIELELRERLSGLGRPLDDSSVFVSTVVDEDVRASFDANYWWKNLRDPVQFSPRVQSLASEGTTFIEISPHPGLENALAETLRIAKCGGSVISTLRRDCEEPVELLRVAAELFVHGHAIDWTKWGLNPSRSVSLRAYPWEHNDFWIPLQETFAIPALTTLEGRPPSTHPSAAPAAMSFVAMIRTTPRNERTHVARTRVAEVVYRLAKLGRRKGDLETPLKTMGFDSILFRALEGELEEELGITSSAALLMSYGTIAGISDALLEQIFSNGSQSMHPEDAPTLTSFEAIAALDKILEGLE